jgi:site-specific DNA-methyltransferase (adenine-specific)
MSDNTSPASKPELSVENHAEVRITPYYQHAGITIYHGDCREILPSLSSVDLVLTDPPYAIGAEYASYKDTEEHLVNLIADVFPLLLKAASVVALTPGIANVHRWPAPRWILAWVQINAQNSTGYWGFNEWQPVLVYGTDPFLSRGLGRRPDVVKTIASPNGLSRWARDNHPCPKPLPSWKKVLARVSPSDTDRVIDPMMGSGTTLDACKQMGRQAIGIEIEERYCEIAAKRLSQEVFDWGIPQSIEGKTGASDNLFSTLESA